MREDKRIIYNGKDMAVKYFVKKVLQDLEEMDAEIEELMRRAREGEVEKTGLKRKVAELQKENEALKEELGAQTLIAMKAKIEVKAYEAVMEPCRTTMDERRGKFE